MKQLPKAQLKKLVKDEKALLKLKKLQFAEKGKEFRYDPYGPGIVPEHIYDALRDPTDPKYKSSKLRRIADGDRVFPVKYFILHHSVGPEFRDTDHDTIAWWYSDVGRNRGYAGVAHSGHYYKGRESFAQAHLAGHWHNGDWCVFPIVDDIWNVVTWGAGNWAINQQAINIENCGRFNSQPDDKVLRSLANWWRPHDEVLKGNTFINGHRDVTATSTACPELLADNIDTIIKYVNNAPQPAPAPLYDFHAEVGKAKVTADGDDLYFLDAPFITASIKGSVPDGTVMDYVGYTTQGSDVEGNRKWWKNSYGSWFSARYAVKVEPPKPEPAPVPLTPKEEFLKKWGINTEVKGTYYVKEPNTPLVDFTTMLPTSTKYAAGHEFGVAGRTADGFMITQFSIDRMIPKGVHESALTDTLEPAEPMPPQEPEDDISWIKRALRSLLNFFGIKM